MVEREVIWSKTAIDQFKVLIFFWQANDVNEKFRQYTIARLDEHIQVILHFPKCGKPYRMTKIREFVFDGFSLFYLVRPKKIMNYLFWDNRQDPAKLNYLLSNSLCN
jgi:hypothetical protein